MDKEKKEEKKYPGEKYRKFLVSQKIIIYNEGKKSFLLLKLKDDNSYFSNKYGLWDVPGGRVDEEEELEESLKREIKEEVGNIEIEIKGLIGFEEIGYRSGAAVVVWYLAKYINGDITLSEHSEYKWEMADDIIKNKDYNPWIKESIKKALKYIEKDNALNSWKRCQADFENYKKDQAKHQEEFRKYAKMDIIEQVLPVLDNFDASFEHIPEGQKKSPWVTGITHIRKQTLDILKNNGVEEIVVKDGDKFDPQIHEAVGGDGKKQVVRKILQKGYKLNGRVLRAARVEVG